MSDNVLPADKDTCLVEFEKKEYAIVGDAFFARSVGEVPDWLVELTGNTIETLNKGTYDVLGQYNYNLLNALESVEVAKNTYDQYINRNISDTEAFVSAITTLNSTVQDNDASIRTLLNTYATQEYAVSTSASMVSASLNGGAIGARIGTVESSLATQYGSLSQRLNTLSSTFNDNARDQESLATATSKLETYTGLGTVDGLPAVIANSSFYRKLDVYLKGTGYDVGGSSTLTNYVKATSTDAAKTVEAKFEYGSEITLNGRTYSAGFGLSQLGTLSPNGITYNSEFWVDAIKFKVINGNNRQGAYPFSIDTSVNPPKIAFNGRVSFDNVTGTDGLIRAKDLGPLGTTVIDGGRITTGTLDASRINVTNLDASNITTGMLHAAHIAADSITVDKIPIGELTDSGTGTAYGGKTSCDGYIMVVPPFSKISITAYHTILYSDYTNIEITMNMSLHDYDTLEYIRNFSSSVTVVSMPPKNFGVMFYSNGTYKTRTVYIKATSDGPNITGVTGSKIAYLYTVHRR